MLKHIPRQKKKITTRQLVELLHAEGFNISQRSVQRDLKALSTIFPDLQSDGNRDMAGWSWRKESIINDFPAIDMPMAVTFKMTQTFMSRLMPPSILNLLSPYFMRSSEVLQGVDQHGVVSWTDKVRILSRTMPLISADISRETVDVVYTAMLEEKQFRGRYLRRDGDEAEYTFHPLGLVFRDSVVYLVATVWDYQDPRHYALHRFTSCELLDDNAAFPEDFSMDIYLQQGSFQYGDEGNIKLTAIFTEEAAFHLQETPLSEDQRLINKQDGSVQVTATVNDGLQLRWWLLGFGDQVEVIRPKALRNEFQQIAQGLHDIYHN